MMRRRGSGSHEVYPALPRLQLETDAGPLFAMTDTPTITARVMLRFSAGPLPL
jgi:hypothetical protein